VSLLLLLGVAVGMAMDTFAVAVGLSCSDRGLGRRQGIRISAAFSLFQILMPLLGWAAGEVSLRHIQAFDHWIAAGLLVVVGGKMIVEGIRGRTGGEPRASDPTRGLTLLVLSLATSMDALAVGLSLGTLGLPILVPAAVIGAVTFVITFAGTKIGPALGRLAGRWAELAGGLVLLAIAAKILVDHLT